MCVCVCDCVSARVPALRLLSRLIFPSSLYAGRAGSGPPLIS